MEIILLVVFGINVGPPTPVFTTIYNFLLETEYMGVICNNYILFIDCYSSGTT